MRGIAERFAALCPEVPCRFNAPMSEYTSFRIGGPVPVLAQPRTAEETVRCVAAARSAEIRYLVVGNGTNLLFPDEGAEMLVVHTAPDTGKITSPERGVLRAEAGASLSAAAVQAMRLGLTGLEFAHGIPGSVGGAVYMNAGAYGGEMKNVVRAAGAFLNEERTYSGEECAFGKRKSRFSESGETILWAEFSLSEGDPEEIRRSMEELARRRRESQPLNLPSAGSFFKRPENGYAGAMIEQCGLKGFAVGGAQVSEKHAGFVVNRGGATCRDVLTLMEEIQKRVRDRFGTMLEPEVRIIRREEA